MKPNELKDLRLEVEDLEEKTAPLALGTYGGGGLANSVSVPMT
jgi:hypothetical protein